MSRPGGPDLRFARVWQTIGVTLVAAVIGLSLTPALPAPGLSINDKSAHLIAYGAMMGWYGQIWYDRRRRALVAAALIVLGLALEGAQAGIGGRYMEWADALANTLGVLLGWGLSATPLRGLLAYLDARLAAGRP